MTLFPTTRSDIFDAVHVLSAVADRFAGRRIGLAMRVANVAARFALFRGDDPETVAVAFYAGALYGIGAVRVVVPRDASSRVAEISRWDDPPAGAAIVAGMGVFPPATGDAIRWHREAFDGTGYPDQLRWNGIPEAAMAINIVRAFVEALEANGSAGSTADAVFMLVAESGCVFNLAAMRKFRAFLAAEPATFEQPYEPAWMAAPVAARALISEICREIDGRFARTAGRGDRLERIVRAIAAQLADPAVDAERAAFAARLTALARTGADGSADDVFTLSRLGLESRAEHAQQAALILRSAPAFADLAAIVEASEEWFDGSGLPAHRAGAAIHPDARVVAVAIAAEAIVAPDARRRIAAAAGTRLDPDVVTAYLAADIER